MWQCLWRLQGECEKTMILSRRSRNVLQVIEYGDAELPEDLPDELREFFPLGIVPFMITERASYGSLDKVLPNGVVCRVSIACP